MACCFVLDVVILLSPTVSIEGQVDFKAKLDLTFIKKVLLMKELKSYESAHFQTCGLIVGCLVRGTKNYFKAE